jgi:hypothetical protein
MDDDGVIDTDVNNNGRADYLEPFLMYYVDPDDFVYGVDFNHNGVIDTRENDNTADYPYDLDSRGYHLFVDLTPTAPVRCTAAAYDIHQRAGAGRNRTLYAEAELRSQPRPWASLRFAERLQRVWDDIADDVAVSTRYTGTADATRIDTLSGFEAMGITTDATITRGGVLDPLAMRNSVVSTTFGQVTVRPCPGLTVGNSLKLDINARRRDSFADGTSQPGSTERLWAFVHKADYALSAGSVTVTPMHKLLVERRVKPSTGRDPFYYAYHWAPILRVDYHFTANTNFRVGFQGLPFVEERYRELSSLHEEYDARSQLLVLQNKGNYSGFDLFLNMGYRRTERDFRTRSTAQSVTDGEYFVQVYME